eukprot:gene56946-biopygen110660
MVRMSQRCQMKPAAAGTVDAPKDFDPQWCTEDSTGIMWWKHDGLMHRVLHDKRTGQTGELQTDWCSPPSQPWGTHWSDGDVIGIAADMSKGEPLFARNGECETVFSNVRRTGGLYPAFTTDADFTANFGADPFRFPPRCIMGTCRGSLGTAQDLAKVMHVAE